MNTTSHLQAARAQRRSTTVYKPYQATVHKGVKTLCSSFKRNMPRKAQMRKGRRHEGWTGMDCVGLSCAGSLACCKCAAAFCSLSPEVGAAGGLEEGVEWHNVQRVQEAQPRVVRVP